MLQIKEELIDKIKDTVREAVIQEFSSIDFSYKEKKNWYVFKSHGLTIVPPDDVGVTDVAIFHFTPQGLQDITQVREDRVSKTKMVISELILASEELEKFLSSHHNTHLGKVVRFEGTTNLNFAKFLTKYFGMKASELEDGKFHIECSMKTLLEKIKVFKEKHRNLISDSNDN